MRRSRCSTTSWSPIGALSIFNFEIDLTILAALLTVVGYSVNDTVVVSDRIRENLRAEKKKPLGVVINESLNQTLSRTLLTGGTTFFVLLTLFFVGGGVIHGFAFTLLVGPGDRHVFVDLHRQPDRRDVVRPRWRTDGGSLTSSWPS